MSAPKFMIERARTIEPTMRGDFFDAQLAISKGSACALESQIAQVFSEADSGLLLEYAAQVRTRQVNRFRKVLEPKV